MKLFVLFASTLFTHIFPVNSGNKNKPTHPAHSKHVIDTNKVSLLDKEHDLNLPKYQDYFRTLLKKAEHINKNHLEILKKKSAKTIENELKTEAKKSKKNSASITSIILDCKKFMQDITKETENDSSINLIYFFTNVEDILLKNIYEIAHIQNSVLDTEMLVIMYNQHDTNHITNKKALVNHPNEKIVIIGADESGLYAALHFFFAGFEVSVVGEQQQKTESDHILVLSDKWIIQLQMFLGTKYSQILEDNENIASYPHFIKVSSIRLQKAMLCRLKELANYAEKIYKKSISSIIQPFINFAQNHPSVRKMIHGRRNPPLQIHLESVATKVQFATVVHATHFLHVNNSESIPFDVLICVKEPKQKIRNMYIGMPNQLSSTENYIVAAWTEENHTNKVLKAEYIEDWVEMEELKEFLDEKNFDEVILSLEVGNEFVGIVSKMILSPQTVRTHLFETKERIYLAVELSEILADTLGKLVTITKFDEKQAEKFDEIKEKLQKNWMEVIVKRYNHKAKAAKILSSGSKFIFNIENMSISPLWQSSLGKPVALYDKHGHAIMAAWGDSAVSSEFYPKMQLSLAKNMIDIGVETMKDYNQGFTNTQHMQQDLSVKTLEILLEHQMQNFQAEVAKWMRTNDSVKESKLAAEIMCSFLEEIRTNQKFEQEYGFEIIRDEKVTIEKPYFYVKKAGKIAYAEVALNGLISFKEINNVVLENKKFYKTIMQAVLKDL